MLTWNLFHRRIGKTSQLTTENCVSGSAMLCSHSVCDHEDPKCSSHQRSGTKCSGHEMSNRKCLKLASKKGPAIMKFLLKVV